MDRRLAVQTGLLGSCAFLLGKTASAEIKNASIQLNEAPVSQKAVTGPRSSVAPAGPKQSSILYQNKINFDSREILDNEINYATTGTEDWGPIGRGIHAREFNVPRGTHLILGHVQEAGHFGLAKYQTLGIAINQEIWRCRVIWRMDWDVDAKLVTYFNWIKF